MLVDLLLVLAVLSTVVGLAAVGVEVALRVALPSWLGTRLTAAFGGPAEVELPTPLLPHVLRRAFPIVTVHATDVPIGDAGGRLDRLDVHLRDVRFLRTRDEPEAVSAGEGRFVATILAANVGRLGDVPPIVRAIDVEPDTLWITTVGGVRLPATVDVDQGDLAVRPRSRSLASLPFGELVIPLPVLPAGAIVTDVRLEDGAVVASGTVDGDRLLDD